MNSNLDDVDQTVMRSDDEEGNDDDTDSLIKSTATTVKKDPARVNFVFGVLLTT